MVWECGSKSGNSITVANSGLPGMRGGQMQEFRVTTTDSLLTFRTCGIPGGFHRIHPNSLGLQVSGPDLHQNFLFVGSSQVLFRGSAAASDRMERRIDIVPVLSALYHWAGISSQFAAGFPVSRDVGLPPTSMPECSCPDCTP